MHNSALWHADMHCKVFLRYIKLQTRCIFMQNTPTHLSGANRTHNEQLFSLSLPALINTGQRNSLGVNKLLQLEGKLTAGCSPDRAAPFSCEVVYASLFIKILFWLDKN